jgi:hypothetical protein
MSEQNELSELKRLAELATPGPWFHSGDHAMKDYGSHSEHIADCMRDGHTAEYVAAANPAVILRLLDRIEALERTTGPRVLPTLMKELDWCIEEGNVGPRTHKFLVSMRAALLSAKEPTT